MELELDYVRSLVKLMSDHNLQEVRLQDGDRKIHLLRDQKVQDKGVVGSIPTVMPAVMQPMQTMQPIQSLSGVSMSPQMASPHPVEVGGGEAALPADIHVVQSPMVGTFYRASSPDAGSFCETGDKVGNDSVLCIIEAMKVMNEINAEVSGEVVDILVANGEAVEYNQPLFHIRISGDA